jgi:glycine/D-amino acid oxidase-like deaminating enzyme
MTKVTIAGCGIIGATIAYELSQVSELDITVVDAQPTPVQPDVSVCPSATGAALGVLMGVISTKEKGNNLRMRLSSIQYYNNLIPELEQQTGLKIPFNRQGILMLEFDDRLSMWNRLAEVRKTQGYALEILEVDQVQSQFPYLNLDGVSAGIYSPSDRQVHPVLLTHALIEGAKQRGVSFQFDTTVMGMNDQTVHTSQGNIESDYLVISAGIGSTQLTSSFSNPVDIRPVLGQAIQVRLPQPFSDAQPVMTGHDVHLVPLGGADYWIGATVEFPTEDGVVLPPDRALFDQVMRQAIAFCPALSTAETIRTWYGLRPRPQGRPAPIIERLPGHNHVLLATGHYRNGVLLAPATAKQAKESILGLDD